jgi:cell division protein FtsL
MFNLTAALPSITTRSKVRGNIKVFYLNLAIIVLIVALGLVYSLELNILSTKGYEIRQAEQQINQLEIQYKNLELQVSNLQSINRIKNEASLLNFVPASDVTYINASDFALK